MIEEIAEAGKALTGTVGGVVDTVAAIAGKLEQWNRLRAETASVIRLLYLETCKDLELLALLGDDRALKWGDPRLRFLIGHFETAIMELVLLGNEKVEVYKKLAAKGRIQDKPETGGKSAARVQKYENVLQAIRFVYVKMDILRKLDAAPGGEVLAGKLQATERLRNIESRLVLVKRILGELDDNRSIA
jgi:hypothetical protein